MSPDKKEDPMTIRDEHADSQHELGHGSSKPGEPPKKDVKLVSKSKTEFDIFWDDNSQEKGEDHNDDSHLNSGQSAKSSPLSEVYSPGSRSPTKMESKEPRLIPRTVLTEAKTVAPVSCSQQVATMPLAATPPETPPNGEESKSIEVSSPDPAMATPTQDESHPDSKDDIYRSLNITSIKSPASPPPLTNEKSKAPDIYDPEAPLESPEDVTFVKQDSDVVDGPNVRPNKSPICAPCSPPKEQIDQPRPIPSTSTTIVSTKSSSSSIKRSRSPARNTSFFPSTTSSSAVVTNSSNPVNSLLARLPVMASLQSPAPNSLLAQIQQTLSQNHQKNQAIQQQHLMNIVSSINSLLKNASSSASCSSSSHLSKSQINSVKNKEVDSPHSPVGQPVSSNATSSRLTLASLQSTANPALKSVIDQLLRVAQGNAKVHSQKPVPSTSTSSASSTRNLFKKPMPVSNQVAKSSSYGFKSSNNSGNSSKHHSHSQSSSHSHHKSKPLNPVDKVFKEPIPVGAVTANNGATNRKMADGTNNDDLPSSAVELQVKEKYLKKLNRQERVVEEVKLVLKPYYQRREVTKDEYKEILRKSVPKICHSKTGEINPVKIKQLIDEYIKRVKHDRKKAKKKPNATSNSNLIS